MAQLITISKKRRSLKIVARSMTAQPVKGGVHLRFSPPLHTHDILVKLAIEDVASIMGQFTMGEISDKLDNSEIAHFLRLSKKIMGGKQMTKYVLAAAAFVLVLSYLTVIAPLHGLWPRRRGKGFIFTLLSPEPITCCSKMNFTEPRWTENGFASRCLACGSILYFGEDDIPSASPLGIERAEQ